MSDGLVDLAGSLGVADERVFERIVKLGRPIGLTVGEVPHQHQGTSRM
jgi:hypothetical protein